MTRQSILPPCMLLITLTLGLALAEPIGVNPSGDASGDYAAVSGDGDANAGLVALALDGDADGRIAALSPTGMAENPSGIACLEIPEYYVCTDKGVAVSGGAGLVTVRDGKTCFGTSPASSCTSDAAETARVDATGPAIALHVADAHVLAVHGSGDAESSWVAVAPQGDAEAGFIAVSGTGEATVAREINCIAAAAMYYCATGGAAVEASDPSMTLTERSTCSGQEAPPGDCPSAPYDDNTVVVASAEDADAEYAVTLQGDAKGDVAISLLGDADGETFGLGGCGVLTTAGHPELCA